MDKGIIINNIISDLKKQGFEKIYASIIGFESPYMIGLKDKHKGYYPDVIGEKEGEVNIFSIETNIDKRISRKDAERWRLYRIYAKANNGNLFLAGSPHNISVIKNSLDTIPNNLKFIHLI